MDVLAHALDQIRAKAAELRDSFGDEARALTLEWTASLLECAIRKRAPAPARRLAARRAAAGARRRGVARRLHTPAAPGTRCSGS